MEKPLSDIFIIGGGINGAAIAADASCRGYSVILCEKGDLGSATSSASTKLIHGGLRYLENYHFGLVRKALQEREVLLKKAPHLVKAMRFIMPYHQQKRHRWLIRLGLFLYDYLVPSHSLPKSKTIKLHQHKAGKPLKKEYTIGFAFSDCWVDDARLVLLNALYAKEHGATILTHTQFVSAKRLNDYWEIHIINTDRNPEIFYSKAIVNAAGPWVEKICQACHVHSLTNTLLVKGSHFIVPKLYDGPHAYLLQNHDGRVVFVIPYENAFSLIGTTEHILDEVPKELTITPEESQYLCDCVNHYFKKSISPKDIIWSYAGIRTLRKESKNASDISRDYSLVLDHRNHQTPFLTVIGGKMTTHRKCAEHTIDKLSKYLPHTQPSKTKTTILHGGDFPKSFDIFIESVHQKYPWLPKHVARRYAKSYGSL